MILADVHQGVAGRIRQVVALGTAVGIPVNNYGIGNFFGEMFGGQMDPLGTWIAKNSILICAELTTDSSQGSPVL
jgi:hypothetical protein